MTWWSCLLKDLGRYFQNFDMVWHRGVGEQNPCFFTTIVMVISCCINVISSKFHTSETWMMGSDSIRHPNLCRWERRNGRLWKVLKSLAHLALFVRSIKPEKSTKTNTTIPKMKRCSNSHEKIWQVYQVSKGCPVFSHANFRLFRSSLNLRGTTKKVGTFQSDHEASSRWWFQTFFIFTPILGKISNLTNIFQMGWNHQPVMIFRVAKASRDPESISTPSRFNHRFNSWPFFINPIVF